MPQHITCDPDVVQQNGASAVTYDFKSAGLQRTKLTIYKHQPPLPDDVEEVYVEEGDEPLVVHAPVGCTGITIEDDGPSDAAAIAVEPS